MARILVVVPHYLPGFKAGGPIRTVANMVSALGGEHEFSVACSDRDLGDAVPYEGVMPGQPNRVGAAEVIYISPGLRGALQMFWLIRLGHFDVLHINSFFSFRFSIALLLMRSFRIFSAPVILGPRGEFSSGAMGIKTKKKRLFIGFAKIIGAYRCIVWHASSEYEAEDIRAIMGASCRIRIAPDISLPLEDAGSLLRRNGGALRIACVARISRMKNLDGALRVLLAVRTPVKFDVYGPVEDEAFWGECLSIACELPENIEFSYKGGLAPAEVMATLSRYDLFFLPTLGENFGHVIAEALFSGLPVLISDQTPWKGLRERDLGWDLPLVDAQSFVDAIEFCGALADPEYLDWRLKIRDWAVKNIANEEIIDKSRRLFALEKSYD